MPADSAYFSQIVKRMRCAPCRIGNADDGSHVVCVRKRKAWGRSQGFKGTMCVKVHLVKEGGPSDKVHRVGDKTNIGGGLCVGDIVYQIVRAV
jgi:hypothetical protein